MPGKISFMRQTLGSTRIGYGVNYKKKAVILDKVIKKYPLFFVPRILITVFTRVCHLSQSLTTSIQSTSPNRFLAGPF